jgi:hypothetical protein
VKRFSPREDRILEALFDRGFSYGEIAAHLPGRTRAMVAGRAWRLGLDSSERPAGWKPRHWREPWRVPERMAA